MRRHFKSILMAVVPFLCIPISYSKTGVDISNWTLNDGVSVSTFQDEEVIKITSGKMLSNDMTFQDGIIEFDLYSSGERAFFYAYFRQPTEEQGETLYLRTHKSNAPDTLQYSPIIQKRSAWQIYHGEKGTASAYLPANTWTKVKLEVRGDKLSVWVGEGNEPVMDKVLLSGLTKKGGLAFRGFIPRNSGAPYAGLIKNIRISQTPSMPISALPEMVKTDGMLPITQMLVSPAFASDKSPTTDVPNGIDWSAWRVAHARHDGIFELLRWQTIPDGVRSWASALKVNLNSASAQTCELRLGYSDAITLVLNEQPLAYMNASYRYADNRQQGVLHDDQLRVFLPLKRGENRLTAVVADSFGGWGFSAALSQCQGVDLSVPDIQR